MIAYLCSLFKVKPSVCLLVVSLIFFSNMCFSVAPFDNRLEAAQATSDARAIVNDIQARIAAAAAPGESNVPGTLLYPGRSTTLFSTVSENFDPLQPQGTFPISGLGDFSPGEFLINEPDNTRRMYRVFDEFIGIDSIRGRPWTALVDYSGSGTSLTVLTYYYNGWLEANGVLNHRTMTVGITYNDGNLTAAIREHQNALPEAVQGRLNPLQTIEVDMNQYNIRQDLFTHQAFDDYAPVPELRVLDHRLPDNLSEQRLTELIENARTLSPERQEEHNAFREGIEPLVCLRNNNN